MAAPFSLPAALAALIFAHAGVAATVSAIDPVPESTVSSLSSVAITFSEPVANVTPESLLVNGEPPQSVAGSGAGPYTFAFAQPSAGPVTIGFGPDIGIAPVSGSGSFEVPESWSYVLTDTIAPAPGVVAPAAGSVAGSLTEARVTFNEPVTGVTGGDLLVNGASATSVSGSGAGPYIFVFAAPAFGTVDFSWAAGHGIMDLAGNAFDASSWSVTRSPSGAGNLVINEFVSLNPSSFVDEDGDNEAWIEIHNPGSAPVNLTGWALTDDPDAPGKWIFPQRSLPAGAYLVVFASGKDRRPVTGELHTNFKVGANGGHLALLKPDQPAAAAAEFAEFPSQRAGYSYGLFNGQKRYLSPPTPNASNSSATTLAAVATMPSPSSGRGYYTSPFALSLSSPTPGATIRYTTNGSEPTATTGTSYTTPIPISGTTVLRAATFANGYVPSETVTATYIFLDHVIDQPALPAGFPSTWGFNSAFPGSIVPADYGMDRDPLRVDIDNPGSAIDPVKLQRYNEGLRELPSVSLAIPGSDMFEPTGMYHSNHVKNKNFGSKAASIEMILPDGSTAFATTAGLRVKGNASREPNKNPKHAFGLNFSPEFGPSKLEYPLFPETPADEYDDLVLRAEFGFSWRHWDGVQRTMSTGIRDMWVKDAMRDMGGVASHSRLVHLYINGLYFGVYNFSEDPQGAFGESFLGGQKEDYDAIEQGILKDGTADAYNGLTSLPGASSNSIYEDYKTRLEMPMFIDYMLLHFFIGSQDWGNNKNWAALRQRAGGTFTTEGRFIYIPWDEENVLINPNSNRVTNNDVPSGLHTDLRQSAQYRLDFADRAHRAVVAPGGALTTSRNIARWQKWQNIFDKPIVAESSRWGDYRRDVHPYMNGQFPLYTRESHWLVENARLVDVHFPQRATVIMQQLRSAGLYPTLNAPVFRAGGADVGSTMLEAGTPITIAMPAPSAGTSSTGSIYYTTDGSDPRVIYSGSIHSSATLYSAPLTIDGPVIVKARARNGDDWSAMNEAVFTTSSTPPPIRITEIMYNPAGGTEFEFIELLNTSNLPVDLNGWYLTGINYVFPPGSVIPPGGRMVIASNDAPAGWRANYTGVTPYAYYRGSLSNGGETIALFNASGVTVSTVTYDDSAPWPQSPDGGGYSLELINPSLDTNDPASWQASASIGGTPGAQNSPSLPPEITVDPQNQVVAQGSTVTFTTVATGPNLQYQWSFDGDPIPSSNSPTYSISSVTPANDGVYRCTVWNTSLSVPSAPATLIVSQTFDQWAVSKELSGADAAVDADTDGDSIRNLSEFYHHLDPEAGATGTDFAALPTASIADDQGSTMFGITYRINRRAAVTSVTTERLSGHGGSWTTATPVAVEELAPDPATGDPIVRALFLLDPDEPASLFRLNITP